MKISIIFRNYTQQLDFVSCFRKAFNNNRWVGVSQLHTRIYINDITNEEMNWINDYFIKKNQYNSLKKLK